MLTFFGTDLLDPEWPSSTVCIGVFDGVHLGHRAVISQAVETARAHNEPCAVLTFDRNPLAVLAPDRAPPALATLGQNLDRFEQLGADLAVVLPFTAATAQTLADDFLKHVLIERARAARLVVGHDFAMGRGREGDTVWLAQRLPTLVVPPLELDGKRVSSTVIRGLVHEGEVEQAARLLGHPFTLRGVVAAGDQIGRKLGFPTANLALGQKQCVPRDGVYYGHGVVSGVRHPAAVSVGDKPSFGGGDRTIEAYLLDYEGPEFYGRSVDVEFIGRLRDQERFGSIDALKEQMDSDIAETRRRLSRTFVG